jgi:ligand-binding sensor domain-containing protein/DNA-binding CsgD family transcriptional regulator
MSRLLFMIFFCLVQAIPVFSQSTIGLPAIRNYRNTDYHAATNISDIGQDKRGVLYFANENGLLTFDGTYWKIYPLPNKAASKSLAIDTAGRIFVGGQDEVGYFSPDHNGILNFHSLKEKLPQIARQFADIWNIVPMGNEVFFRTIETIFEYAGDSLRTFDAPGGWQLMTKVDGRLYAADKIKGLFVFRDEQWQSICPGTAGLHVTGIMPYKKDSLLITTLKNGLYVLGGTGVTAESGVTGSGSATTGAGLVRKPTGADALLMNDLINRAKRIGEDRFAMGTATGGLLILDGQGRLIQRFSSAEGLQNNDIQSIMSDQDTNLWLGLDNGIAFVSYNTSVKLIRPVKDNQLLSNVVKVFDQKLFIGTSNGLYTIPLDTTIPDFSQLKGVFSEVGNTKGQVWSLEEINHDLVMGHQDGAYVIRDGKATPVLTQQGVWDVRVDRGGAGGAAGAGAGAGAEPGAGAGATATGIIAGTYTGLRWIGDQKGQFTEGDKLNDLYESLPVIAVDPQGTVWASHPYRGVYKNSLPGKDGKPIHYKHYGPKEGLPSDLSDFVQVINGKVVVATEKGVYEYDEALDGFRPSAVFQPIFHDNSVEYLTQDKEGNIWFVSNQRVGVIDYSKRSGSDPYAIIYFPELTGETVQGASFIYPYNRDNIFIGSNNGVFHLNFGQYIHSDNKITVLLGAVKAIAEKDSLIYGGYAACPKSAVQLPIHWNSFHFEYSSPSYAPQSDVEFSYQLTGFDKGWSGWSSRTEKDYTNLPYGQYTFNVRARDNLGNISATVSFTFIVDPAWYQTGWAWLLYTLIAAALLYAVRLRQQRRLALHQKQHREEQERLSYLHSLELDRKEKGLIALQNAKLEGELQFKNKELATVTMYLVERGGLLSNMKEELLGVIKKLNIPNLAYELRGVFKMILDTEKSNEDWDRFALYFDQVHNNFLTILKTKFPQLSPTDLKLCAYLRLNLSSKEIAHILNISLKGVEVSRYRIRKKLGLPTETNLYDFLIETTSGVTE